MYSMRTHFVLLKTARVPLKSVEGHRMMTTDVHAMSLSSFMRRSNRLTLFKGITAVITVGEIDRCLL